MSDVRPTVLIIDGNSFMHRSFHALFSFSNKEGFPTNAITGTLNMIVSLLNKYNPTKVVVCFDAKGKNFRHDIYPDYKGDRPPSDPNLSVQFQPIKDIVEAWGLPMLSISGVEADDTMGTVACRSVEEGFDAVISTSDKDMRQLVSDRIKIIDTKDATDKTPYGAEGVIERMGVAPERVRDLLALMGDSSDGVPGVEDVGQVTARKWLDKYGSLDGVIENADKIGGKRGEQLRKSLSTLPLSYELVSLRLDVPLPSTVALLSGTRDEQRLFDLTTKYELNQFKRNISVTNPNSESIESEVVICETDASVSVLNNKLSKLSAQTLFVDASDSDEGYVCVGINGVEKTYVVPMNAIADTLKQRYLNENFPVLVGNNVKRFISALISLGALPQYPQVKFHDSRLAYYTHLGGRSKLPSIALLNNTYANLEMSPLRVKFKLDDKTPRWDKLSLSEWGMLKSEELLLALKIRSEFESADEPLLSENDRVLLHSESLLLPVLATMESQGLLIDGSYLETLDVALKEEADVIEAKIKEISGVDNINLNSAKQVGNLLFNVMGIPIKKPSTAEKVLLKLADDYPIVLDILQYRSLFTLRSRYIQGLLGRMDSEHKVHPQFNQGLTSTGRLSAEDPNVQSIPVRSENGRKIREAFVANRGKFVAADYSQVELRVVAHLSGDEALIAAFKSDKDIHRLTASEILGVEYDTVTDDQRRIAKAINFGLIYGIGAKRLASETGVSLQEAKLYMESYFLRYPAIKPYFENQLNFAKENGYVETITGRKIYTPDVNASNPLVRVHAELSAKNASVQGTAADIIKQAMLDIVNSDIDHNDVQMVMQVHDELIFYVSDDALLSAMSKIPKIMEGAFSLKVPLKVDINSGNNWSEAH